MLFSNKNKCIARSLELQSLRTWFKRLPLIHESHNCSNNSKCLSCPYERKQSYIQEIIQNDYIDRPFVEFHTRLILRNIFESWKIYAIYKLRKRKALCEADHIYRRRLKRNVFNVLARNIINSNKHYNTTIKRLYFKLWKKYIKVAQTNQMLIKKSNTFYIKKYLQKSMTIWKEFVLYRKKKSTLQKKLAEKACKLYDSNLLYKYFMAWISAHNFIKAFKEQLEIAVNNYNKKILHKYFVVWTAYSNMKKKKKYLQDSAEQQYCQRLLKQYFKQFILYIHEVHVQREKLTLANTFYESKIIVKIFKTWVEWYYQVSRIRSIMAKAQQIADGKTKQKTVLHWQLYVFHKKCIRRKMSLCLTIYHKKICTNAFKKLQDYVLYRKKKKTEISNINNRAITIIASIQSIYIDKWKQALNIRMQEKCKIFQAVEFYNNYISRKYIFWWRKFSQQYKYKLLQKRELNERAACFLLNKYITVWKLKCEEKYKIYEKEKLLASIIHKRIQRKYFTFWIKYRNYKMNKRKDIEYAKDMNKKFLLQEGLRELLRHSLFTMQFHHENRLKYATSKSVEDFEILNHYFGRWSSIVNLKEKLESLPLQRIDYCYDKDIVIPPKYTVNKSSELSILFMNDTNNNLCFNSLYEDESMLSLTNNVELLPPSAFY